MKSLNTLFVDFNNTDKEGRVRLNTVGTKKDIEVKKIVLRSGLEVVLDDQDELQVIGIVEFSDYEKIWVAKVNWNDLT